MLPILGDDPGWTGTPVRVPVTRRDNCLALSACLDTAWAVKVPGTEEGLRL